MNKGKRSVNSFYKVHQLNQEHGVLHSNMDSFFLFVFFNKKDELMAIVCNSKPKIIALTEIIAKSQKECNRSEYSIPGYDLFINKNLTLRTAVFIDSRLNAVECIQLNNHSFEESVCCTFTSTEGQSVLIGCIYKSPSSDNENVMNLFDLMKSEKIKCYDKVCIVGDFNFPSIKWNREFWGNTENEFVECIHDALLFQVAKHPTRNRGSEAFFD